MSYIDERGEYYSTGAGSHGVGGGIGYDEEEGGRAGLVRGAAPYGGRESESRLGGSSWGDEGRSKKMGQMGEF